MAMPGKDELPFYDADAHDTLTDEETVELSQAWTAYREHLRTGTTPDE